MDFVVTNKIFSPELGEKVARIEAKKEKIKKRSFEFISTESNRDTYLCELVLRRVEDVYKIKLTHFAGILHYPAIEILWQFNDREGQLASTVFETVAYTLEGIREDYNRSMSHPLTLTPIIREAVRPVSETHRLKTNIPSLDEREYMPGEANIEQIIYGNRYPAYSESNKTQHHFYQGNQTEPVVKRTMHRGRSRKRR